MKPAAWALIVQVVGLFLFIILELEDDYYGKKRMGRLQ